MRHGNWQETTSFSLGAYYGEPVISDRFATEFVNVVPVLAEFIPSGVDPSGSRHLTSHASFDEILASGRGIASLDFGHIDLQSVNIGSGLGVSCTKAILFRVAEFDCNSTRVSNMKLWASSVTDFLTRNTHRIIFETSRTWQQNKHLPISSLDEPSKFLPESLPEFQNLYRQDGKLTIHGTGDSDVSEWAYLALVGSGTLPLAQYGFTAASGFLIRVSYDVDNIERLQD